MYMSGGSFMGLAASSLFPLSIRVVGSHFPSSYVTPAMRLHRLPPLLSQKSSSRLVQSSGCVTNPSAHKAAL